MIDPARLTGIDTREMEIPYGGRGAKLPVQRTRDAIKTLTAMTDHQRAYLILAIENQSEIHYAMPVRNMVQDSLQYARQISEATEAHKKNEDYKGKDEASFLSGFLKTDRLIPVITLVIYFGAQKWDGPLSVHEMFAPQEPEILALVPDYKINLIVPAAIPDEDFAKFHSTLKEVLSFIKYSGDAVKLKTLVNSDPGFQALGRREVDVLNYCVSANLTVQKRQGAMDVCKALQDLERMAAEKAAAEVEKEAEKKRISSLLSAVKSLMQKMEWSPDQTMNAMSISAEDREILLPLLQ